MWETLTTKEKVKYKNYCDKKYGKTIVFCGEQPMYFNKDGSLINTSIILDLLFNKNKN